MAADTPTMAQQLSDALNSQESTVFSELSRQDLRNMLSQIDSQIAWCQQEKDRLTALMVEQEAMIPATSEGAIETEASQEATMERQRVTELSQRLLNEASQNQSILDEVLKARVSVVEHMSRLFQELDAAQQGAQAEAAALEKSLEANKATRKSNPGMDEAQKKLNKIKHDRCIFFGCIDVHPPDLFEL